MRYKSLWKALGMVSCEFDPNPRKAGKWKRECNKARKGGEKQIKIDYGGGFGGPKYSVYYLTPRGSWGENNMGKIVATVKRGSMKGMDRREFRSYVEGCLRNVNYIL